MTLVAGVDSSTQSCKLVICDADSGEVVRSAGAPHPAGTEVHPDRWWDALRTAISAVGGLDDVDAVSVAGQQHGMICLDESGTVVRDALLWNDTRSASAAADLIDDLGGPQKWAETVGVVPVASITAAKLRWLADNEPHNADATAVVCLPHDWLTWRLSESTDISTLTTDRSDASGTGYFSAARDEYRPDLLGLALRGRTPLLPEVIEPSGVAARTPGGVALGAGLGDNAAAAFGLQAGPGDAIVSLGTSGVVSAVTDVAPCDPSGIVAGFADATGRQLPLVCTLNGAPVLSATATMLDVDLDEFARLAMSTPAGSNGLTLIPYLAGERSPNLPDATGTLCGITTANFTPSSVARAAVEGLLCSLVWCREQIEEQGVDVERILMVGGGTKSTAVRTVAPTVFGGTVSLPADGEWVALGAARQAAWALTGRRPSWPVDVEELSGHTRPEVYATYRDVVARSTR
ncbi:xylulokinase [Gordonia otitidis]|nr:FGGY family carbohydrate kinase [Gordonia otitidis]